MTLYTDSMRDNTAVSRLSNGHKTLHKCPNTFVATVVEMKTVKLALGETTQTLTLAIPCPMRAQPVQSAGFVITAFFHSE
jgi:hypothetical protein